MRQVQALLRYRRRDKHVQLARLEIRQGPLLPLHTTQQFFDVSSTDERAGMQLKQSVAEGAAACNESLGQWQRVCGSQKGRVSTFSKEGMAPSRPPLPIMAAQCRKSRGLQLLISQFRASTVNLRLQKMMQDHGLVLFSGGSFSCSGARSCNQQY